MRFKRSSPASTPAMYSRLIRKMPWTISKGTPIMSCSKALKPSCSRLHTAQKDGKGQSSVPPRNVPSSKAGMFLPDVHEHVAEEAPHLCAVAGVVDQGALHEVGLVGLQDPLVQHDAVAHEDDNLQSDTGDRPWGWNCKTLKRHLGHLVQIHSFLSRMNTLLFVWFKMAGQYPILAVGDKSIRPLRIMTISGEMARVY